MKERLKKLNKSIEPYYALLTMILFFGGILITIYKSIISPTDLKLIVVDESIHYPASVSNSVAKLYNVARQKDSLKIPAITIYDFLVNTTSHKKLTLKNVSEKTIRGVKFKYLNVDHLTGWGTTADYLTTKENATLNQSLDYDDDRKIISIKNSLDLPAKSEVVIDLWGSFKNSFLNDDIIATYDEGDASVETTYTVEGIKGYILNYYFEIIILSLMVFSVCYIVGIQQIKKKYAIQTAGDQSD